MNEQQIYLSNSFNEAPPLFRSKEQQHYSSFPKQALEESLSNDQPIDEQLLIKTSQLHESLRNKKLLQFQLLEAEIMKKSTFLTATQVEADINSINALKQQIKKENKQLDKALPQLTDQIEQKKKINQTLSDKISERKRDIVRQKTTLEKMKKENRPLQAKQSKSKDQQQRFISVEKVKLQAENQTKQGILTQIKFMIKQAKDKLTKQQSKHQEVEKQYQELLAELKTEEKTYSKALKSQIPQIKIKFQTQRQRSEIYQSSVYETEKQNNMNTQNIPTHKPYQSLQKNKITAPNFSSQLGTKKQEPNSKVLMKWTQTGKKIPTKKLY